MNLQEPSPAPDVPRMREWMSAWADGQRDAESSACAAWVADPQAQRAWHEYHLIGDVLRSEDLSASPVHDQAFLASFRQRMAAEPVLLAPSPAPAPVTVAPLAAAPRTVSRRWAVAAAAAGVMMVGGAVLSLQRVADPIVSENSKGAGPGGSSVEGAPVRVVLPGGGGGDAQLRVDGQIIRDARLDAYLRAHRGGQGVRPGAVSGRFETVVLER